MTDAPEGLPPASSRDPQARSGIPPGHAHGPVVPEHPESTKALVLGLVSVVGGFACFVPLALGPYAWVVGRRVVRAVDAEPNRWGGRPQATAGHVLGVVATVFLALGLMLLLGVVALFGYAYLSFDSRTNQPFGGL